MKTLVIYDSLGGNTQQVAQAIHETVEAQWGNSTLLNAGKDVEIDFFDYDLIIVGSPVIDWLPTKTLMDLVLRTMKGYVKAGLIKPSSPIIPGKFGVCFGTFAGPHIGEREAIPMTAWLQSFIEHLGYLSLDAWHVPGAFKKREELNKFGRLGDISSRPNEHDLADVKNRVTGLLASLEAYRS